MNTFPIETTISIQIRVRCKLAEKQDATEFISFLGFRVCNWDHHDDGTVTLYGIKIFSAQRNKHEK